jgi:L-glyceraldehyde 3-phosphate reductase
LHQPSYSILNRWIETDRTIDACGELGIGMIAFSPLAQGVLSGKYNTGQTQGARGTSNNPFLKAENIKPQTLEAVGKLATIAHERGQSLPQMALAWVLRRNELTSALIGIRTLQQLEDNLGALNNLDFAPEELAAIDAATATGQTPGHPRWW